MAANLLPLFLTFLLCNVKLMKAKMFSEFSRNSSLDNNVCLETDAVFVSTSVDVSQCLWKCSLKSSCLSAFYSKNDGRCTGCSAAYIRTGDVSENIGTEYYVLRPTPLIRLIGGSRSGRLEVKYNGAWGTVCDDGFSNNAARVVCRSLGYPTANARVTDGHGGSGAILLDDVHCTGTEHSIEECQHAPWASHNCRHDEDVGITCY